MTDMVGRYTRIGGHCCGVPASSLTCSLSRPDDRGESPADTRYRGTIPVGNWPTSVKMAAGLFTGSPAPALLAGRHDTSTASCGPAPGHHVGHVRCRARSFSSLTGGACCPLTARCQLIPALPGVPPHEFAQVAALVPVAGTRYG